jgi:rod shape-determining protein MreD
MGGVAVLQSTVLQFVSIAGVQPDLVLIVLIFVANKNGSMIGQLAGLCGGIVLDVMGLAPLGFFALVYTVIGSLYGITKGKMFVDPIFMPVLLAVVALIIKGLLGAAIAGIFGVSGVAMRVFSAAYLIELGYTAVLSPVFFGLLRLIRPLQPERRRGERL